MELWVAIQDMLNAAANLSKVFWGSKLRGGLPRDRAEERRHLRGRYEVEDTSALKDVTMRNNFEHMDERIDVWREKSRVGHIDFHAAHGPAIELPNPIDVFRTLDLDTMDVTFWGEVFNLRALADEARRLVAVYPRAEPRGLNYPVP